MAFKMTRPTFGESPNQMNSPAKHSGEEMYSEENAKGNRGEPGHSGSETINTNRRRREADHDGFHIKNGPSHDVTPSWEKGSSEEKAPLEMNSPVKSDKQEDVANKQPVVSSESPGENWVKEKGTNQWSYVEPVESFNAEARPLIRKEQVSSPDLTSDQITNIAREKEDLLSPDDNSPEALEMRKAAMTDTERSRLLNSFDKS